MSRWLVRMFPTAVRQLGCDSLIALCSPAILALLLLCQLLLMRIHLTAVYVLDLCLVEENHNISCQLIELS